MLTAASVPYFFKIFNWYWLKSQSHNTLDKFYYKEVPMKKLFKSLKSKSTLCSLCLALGTTIFVYYGSFLFLGEPELPVELKEE
jgi:hypothetical protein